MKSYTEKEFLELVENDSNINFLAAAITPLHAIGVDAAILQLVEQGIELHGYILCVAHNVTGNAINDSNFHMKKVEGIEVIQMLTSGEREGVKERIYTKYQQYRYYLKKKNQTLESLYWVVPMKPSYELIPRVAKVLPNKKLYMILTDEGLGGYLDSKLTWWTTGIKECGIKEMIQSAFRIYMRDPFFLYCLNKRHQIQYERLLNGEKTDWNPNEKVVKNYRKIMGMEESKEDYSNYIGAVLINTDTLYESGRLHDSVDVDIYVKICNYLDEKGINVILKAHPREKKVERYQEMKCEIEQRAGAAQETILSQLKEKPLCVIGIASTTLVNAKILFGINAISINKLIDKRELEPQDFYKRFNRTFQKLLYTPETMAELYADIESIIKER